MTVCMTKVMLNFTLLVSRLVSQTLMKKKITVDEGKLVCEAKVNLLQMQHMIDDDALFSSWSVQLVGLTALFSTVVYDGDNLFVCIPQFTVILPSCIEELDGFGDSLTKLLSFVFHVEENDKHIKSVI